MSGGRPPGPWHELRAARGVQSEAHWRPRPCMPVLCLAVAAGRCLAHSSMAQRIPQPLLLLLLLLVLLLLLMVI